MLNVKDGGNAFVGISAMTMAKGLISRNWIERSVDGDANFEKLDLLVSKFHTI